MTVGIYNKIRYFLKGKFKIAALFLAFLYLVLPTIVYAKQTGKNFLRFLYFSGYGDESMRQNSASPEDLVVPYVTTILQALFSLLGVIFFLIILYAGWLWMTAGGNEEQLTKAKGLLKSAVIGLAIVLAAYAITYLVFYWTGLGLYDTKMKAGGFLGN